MSMLRPFRHPAPTGLASRPSRRAAARNSWGLSGTEPTLGEVMSDPLVHLLMQSDGVGPEALAQLVANAQAGLRGLVCCDEAA